MLRIIIALFMLFQGVAHAFFNTETNYQKQLLVLKEFDLPPSFLKDSMFISMKDDVETYKTKHFLKTLENGDRFVPILQQMMQDAGVPTEFLYLAMTESSFNPYSSSSAKAMGLWQFIPDTAKLYRLVNNAYVDERRDPVKSTEAAVKYLNSLHNMFGKWYLAALAYNCGEGRLSKAIEKAGTDDINILLDEEKKYLPKESRMYIRKILMMSFISNSTDFMLDNGSEHLLNRANNDTFIKVDVKNGTHLRDVAQSLYVTVDELKLFNPHLKHAFTDPTNGPSYIYIPQDKQVAFTQNFDLTKEPRKYAVYTTKKGDTLESIAKKSGLSAHEIAQLNGLKTGALSPKVDIVLPKDSSKNLAMATPEKSTAVYVIKAGDTMEMVARHYDISVAQLMKINNKKNRLVKAGDRIVVPKN